MSWLESSDNQIKAHALDMWANWIETGDPMLSARDVINRGGNLENIVTPDKAELISKLRRLAGKEDIHRRFN
jgi:hypothetical protein